MRTRTKIVRVLVLAAIAVAVLPRPAFADGFGIGAKAGYVYSGLSFSDAKDVFNSDSGWMAGLFFGNKAPVGVLAELNYLRKRVTDAATGARTDLNYLDIPVLIKFNIGSTRANGVSFYIMGGPGFDFKVGDSVSSIARVQNYENFDFTLIAAGGLEITRFIIEGRGQWGLTNIAVNQLSTGDLHSHSFLLLFGVRFN
jgi:hypothetical protein